MVQDLIVRVDQGKPYRAEMKGSKAKRLQGKATGQVGPMDPSKTLETEEQLLPVADERNIRAEGLGG